MVSFIHCNRSYLASAWLWLSSHCEGWILLVECAEVQLTLRIKFHWRVRVRGQMEGRITVHYHLCKDKCRLD